MCARIQSAERVFDVFECTELLVTLAEQRREAVVVQALMQQHVLLTLLAAAEKCSNVVGVKCYDCHGKIYCRRLTANRITCTSATFAPFYIHSRKVCAALQDCFISMHSCAESALSIFFFVLLYSRHTIASSHVSTFRRWPT